MLLVAEDSFIPLYELLDASIRAIERQLLPLLVLNVRFEVIQQVVDHCANLVGQSRVVGLSGANPSSPLLTFSNLDDLRSIIVVQCVAFDSKFAFHWIFLHEFSHLQSQISLQIIYFFIDPGSKAVKLSIQLCAHSGDINPTFARSSLQSFLKL